MAHVFISYRREDTGDFWVDAILMYLSSEFGARNFFKDTESIKAGSQWLETLNKELEEVSVVLVLIGPDFFTLEGKSGKPRILEKEDMVRTEISEAIRLGKNIIPVLVPQAKLPDKKVLPKNIRQLLDIEVFRLKKTMDINQLIVKLEKYIPGGALHDASSSGNFVNRGYDSADEICARATTQTVATLIDLGWYLRNENKKLILAHPKFPTFRFDVKLELAAIILEQLLTNYWGQERWKKKAFFSVSTSPTNILNSAILDISDDLRQAATRPKKYLVKKGSTSSRKIRGILRGRSKKSHKDLVVRTARRNSPEQRLKSMEYFSKGLQLDKLKSDERGDITFHDNQKRSKKSRRLASESANLKERNRLISGIQHKWLTFHPKENILVVGGAEKGIQVWSLDQKGKDTSVGKLMGHRSTTNSGAFSADGLLASASDDGTVRIWDVHQKKQIRKNQLFGFLLRLKYQFFCQVYCVKWSSAGRVLATASERKKIHLWNTESGTSLPSIKLKYNASVVAFNPKNGQLASDGFDDHIGIYDIQSRKWVHKISHNNPGYIGELHFSPDGKILAAGGKEAVIFLYDAITGKPLEILAGHDVNDGIGPNSIRSIRFSPNGRWLASTSKDNFLIIWDMKTMTMSTSYEYETWLFLVGEGVPGLAWSHDSRWLALPSTDGEIQILEVKALS